MKKLHASDNGCCIYSPPQLDGIMVNIVILTYELSEFMCKFPGRLPLGDGMLIRVYLHSGFVDLRFLVASWAFLGLSAISILPPHIKNLTIRMLSNIVNIQNPQSMSA